MITFTYLSTVLELPNPQIPMTHTVNVKTKFEHDMTGALHSTRYTLAADKFSIPIEEITHAKKLEAEAFFILCRGQTIRYIDEQSNIYFGKIITEEIEFVNTNHRAGEQFTYNFEVTFEVVL
jgi:hypothetical protein